MNEDAKSIYSQCKKDEISSDEDTCHKISTDSNLKSGKMSINSTFINKRVSDHNLKYSDFSCVKKLSYSYKKFNAKRKNYDKENEVLHGQQRSIQLALPTDELNSSRFHSTQKIRGVQGSVIFNSQEIPCTSSSNDHAYANTRFPDDYTFSSTIFSNNSRATPSSSFPNNNRAAPSTSFSDNWNFPSTRFSDNRAVPSTSVLDIWAFPSTSHCDDQVVRSKSFSDNKELQRTCFSDGKMTPVVSFNHWYSVGEKVFAEQMPTDLHNLLENLELEDSSDNESVEVNVSDSSDSESMTEAFPPSVLNSKKPAKESDSPINKCNEERKKISWETWERLSNLEYLSPIQKIHSKGNSETAVTEAGKNKEDISSEDHEKYQANRKRRIYENQCHSRGVFDLASGLKKFKPL